MIANQSQLSKDLGLLISEILRAEDIKDSAWVQLRLGLGTRNIMVVLQGKFNFLYKLSILLIPSTNIPKVRFAHLSHTKLPSIDS